jgi:8-oxo-dGTP diphosphatase
VWGLIRRRVNFDIILPAMAILRGVSAVVLNKKSEVLLIQRHDLRTWVFPGGRINEGENPEEAVKREVEEETGIEIKAKRLAVISLRDHLLWKGINLVFLAERVGGEERGQRGEVVQLCWVKKQELAKFLSKRHYQRFLDVISDRDIKLRVNREFPISLRKIPSFLWRRSLGKWLGKKKDKNES